jgi:hypothetical protein
LAYGIGASGCNSAGLWQTGTLIGVSQVGNTLTIVSFTRFNGDSSTPLDQITYTLATPASFTPQPVSTFQTGRYVGPGVVLAGKAVIDVAGRGNSGGGVTQWSLGAGTGADNCTFPSSATWYAGPIANNPYAARLKSAVITSTVYSYGVGASGCNSAGLWQTGTLIGVNQVGNTLTIVSFTRFNGDSSTPLDQITYTLAQ